MGQEEDFRNTATFDNDPLWTTGYHIILQTYIQTYKENARRILEAVTSHMLHTHTPPHTHTHTYIYTRTYIYVRTYVHMYNDPLWTMGKLIIVVLS